MFFWLVATSKLPETGVYVGGNVDVVALTTSHLLLTREAVRATPRLRRAARHKAG